MCDIGLLRFIMLRRIVRGGPRAAVVTFDEGPKTIAALIEEGAAK